MEKFFRVLAVIIIGILAMSALTGCTDEETTSIKLKVVASTSLITQIVERIGGDRVDVVNIIPPGQCPGHFDVKPGDIQQLAEADLFLLHGWQGEKFSEELIATAKNPDLTVISFDIPSNSESNWMVPSVQQEATDGVAAALSQVDSANSGAYQASADEYKKAIEIKEAELQGRLAGQNLTNVNVICSGMQAAFLDWVGLNVVTFYGRPDTLTPQVVQDIVDLGRSEDVVLVVENMQSGADAGAGIAEDLGCARIILSNFPGGYENTDTWEDTIDYNVQLLLAALLE